MPEIDFFTISPLDSRYRASNPEMFAAYAAYLSEEAAVRYQAKVEAALARALANRGICTPEQAEEIERAAAAVTPAEVQEEERRTRHNVRALVNVIQSKVSPASRPFVHLTATSVDITDTARALQFRDAVRHLLLPQLLELWDLWAAIARREADTVQMGRTHGQHAVPITFGFAVVQYVSRLGERIKLVEKTARNLRGKFAGAVGAYNASSLFFDDPETFEKEVLEEVGLLPSETSTQVVQPEYLTDFIHAITSTFGVLANLADDFRHLQRTEISEVGEYFAKDQVGSSTMPHKRNPWNFEHVKSLWKEFAPRIITMYMDQISEHQRDLTNSASQRFLVEMVAGLVLAAKRLTKVLGKLAVDRKRMRENFESTSQMVIAEPLYILLATAGHPDAHECVRKLTLKAEQEGKQLPELVASSEELEPYLSKLTAQQKEILISPETYLGASVRKVETICQRWEQYLDQRGEENA